MSGFGDSEPDDALDASAPDADPEQVAIRLHELRVSLEAARGTLLPHWSELSDDERAVGVEILRQLVTWLHDQGAQLR